MEKVNIKFWPAHEVSQLDRYTRRTVNRGQETETHVQFVGELEFRGFNQGFVVYGHIQQRSYDTVKLTKKLRAAIVAGLPNRIIFNLFAPTEISVKTDAAELDAEEAESSVDPHTSDIFAKQVKIGNEAVTRWEESIDEIRTKLKDDYKNHRSEILRAFIFFERCNSASWQDMMYSWCQEKLGYMRRGFANLDQRKNANHPGYQVIVDDIRGHLNNWPVVNVWHQQPPQR